MTQRIKQRMKQESLSRENLLRILKWKNLELRSVITEIKIHCSKLITDSRQQKKNQ